MKQIFTILLFGLFLFAGNLLFAQGPAIEWQRCIGGGYGDYAHATEPTSDGGYIVAGYSGSNDGDITGHHGNPIVSDYWVVKLNSTGNVEWQRSLGGSNQDMATAIHQTPDGGYIVAGSSISSDGDVTNTHFSSDYWLVKLSSSGNIEWQRSMGGSLNEYCYAMELTNDGGYILAGLTESDDADVSGNHGSRDYWIVKVNSTGNIQWQKCLGGDFNDQAYSIALTPDGGYIVAGYTESDNEDVSGNHGTRDYWVVKLSSLGSLEWQKSLGGSFWDEASSIKTTADGGYIVAGYSTSNNNDVSGNHQASASVSDYWIVKLSNTGNIQWQKCLGGNSNEQAYSIAVAPDGGYVIAGYAESSDGDVTCHMSYEDYWIVKLNSTGIIEWQKIIGGNTTDRAFSINTTPDGGYIVTGFTASNDINGYHPNLGSEAGDYWIIKLSAQVINAANPSITITASGNDVCAGTTITFTAIALNAGITPSYQWKLNNVNAGSNTTIFSSNTLINGDQVNCVLTPANNLCSNAAVSSAAVTMVINDLPVITISPADTTVAPGSRVQLNATVSGFLSSYNWAPANKLENPFSLSSATVPLTSNTTYTIATVSNKGCIADKEVTIKIFKPLYMPNAFTPNGDGVNDVFRIPPDVSLLLNDFSVYDRWGKKIFTTRNISKGWDGYNNGKQAATGVYVYTIKGSDEKGSVFLKGNFVLIR